MIINQLEIDGCCLIELEMLQDRRGSFTKMYNADAYKGTVLDSFLLEEEFITISNRNVLRGLHFQTPPMDHDKIVTCLSGRVIDFFLDIRVRSKTYGKLCSIELQGGKPQLLFLPKGIAHGFLTLEDNSSMLYKTNKVYSPENDAGIHWASVGLKFNLPDSELIVSERDLAFPKLSEFRSPFQ